MSHLLDVNFLFACGWDIHADYTRANRWLAEVASFATCPLTELGFIRVSLSPAFGAGLSDALESLAAILRMRNHRFLSDSTRAHQLPRVRGTKEVSDAHLVLLARSHHLRLATFDAGLCRIEWARGIAEDPTR